MYLALLYKAIPYMTNSAVYLTLLQLLSRTYAQAVAGVTTLMQYSHETNEFTLKYHTTSSCTSYVTEVTHS